MSFYHRSSHSLAVIAAMLVLAVGGCDTADSSDGIVHRVSLKKDGLQMYDFSYASLDSSETPIYQSEGRFAARIAATNDRVGELTDLVKIETYMVDDEDEMHAIWYRQTRSDLQELAYFVTGGIPIAPLKRSSEPMRPLSLYGLPMTVSMLLNERLAKGGQEDTIQFRTDPRIVFVYPLEAGASWTALTSPFVQTREVLGYRNVKVKAGTFRCAEVRTRIPELAPNMDWVDCVSEVGLVLRVVTHEKERRDAQNNPSGTFRTEERLELVSQGG